jgi:ferredoxin--NADP+ reductase
MFKILKKEDIAQDTKLFIVSAPDIAKKSKAGQFVILRVNEHGERFPLTIADYDRDNNTISLIVQVVGSSTMKMAHLIVGENIVDVAGPLGRETHIEKYGTVVLVGGGIGIACINPIAKELKKAGNRVVSILGAKGKNRMFWVDRLKAASDSVHTVTDDGSYGDKGLVSDELLRLIKQGEKIDLVMAVGPAIMMKAVSEVTRPYNIKTLVSLNSIMVDGTGMCGGCRVEVDGRTRYACVDGPEFDGRLVNFDLLIKRQSMYKEHEGQAAEKCRLELNKDGNRKK